MKTKLIIVIGFLSVCAYGAGTNLFDFISGDGSLLTGLNASSLSSGTVAPARLGSGSGGSTKFLREDSTFQTIGGASTFDTTQFGSGGGGTNIISGSSQTNNQFYAVSRFSSSPAISILSTNATNGFTFGNGAWAANQTVAYVQSAQSNVDFAFDVTSLGTGNQNVWIDIGGPDFVNGKPGNYESIRVYKAGAGSAEISCTKGGTGTVRDIYMQQSGGAVYIGVNSGSTPVLTLNMNSGATTTGNRLGFYRDSTIGNASIIDSYRYDSFTRQPLLFKASQFGWLDGSGNIMAQVDTVGNLDVKSTSVSSNGFFSTVSNAAPVTVVTLPANDGANVTYFTNAFGFSIMFAFQGATGATVGLGTTALAQTAYRQWPMAALGTSAYVPMRANAVCTITNTVQPTIVTWTPFP